MHNLAFQGLFPAELLGQLGLPDSSFSVEGLEFFGQISFLKAGLNYADKLTTVSPELCRGDHLGRVRHGAGRSAVAAEERSDRILNGIDDHVWNPESDPSLPGRYSADDLANKTECKDQLQKGWGLETDTTAPLFVFAARLEAQKMADTLLEILPQMMARPRVQLAVVGQGARALQDGFSEWTARMPGRISARIGYREDWAHQLLAGGDMLVHGARFEPCGLTPMYAMRYGAVPIVRAVGGLKDSVTAVTDESLETGKASGFHLLRRPPPACSKPSIAHCRCSGIAGIGSACSRRACARISPGGTRPAIPPAL